MILIFGVDLDPIQDRLKHGLNVRELPGSNLAEFPLGNFAVEMHQANLVAGKLAQ